MTTQKPIHRRALTERVTTVRVLTESAYPKEAWQIVERKEPSKDVLLVVRGEFARADRPTGNNRVYESRLMRREVKRLQSAIAERKVLGEVDHPKAGEASLKNVSHVITKLDGPDKDGVIMGEAEILPTDAGRNLAAIFRAKCKVGVSTRGFGTTSVIEGRDQVERVNDDYVLHTLDFVLDPADADAYPEAMMESVRGALAANTDHDVSRAVLLEEASRAGHSQGIAEAEAALKRRFAEELPALLEAARREGAELVRKELADGPAAIAVFAEIKRILLPHILEVDRAGALTEARDLLAQERIRAEAVLAEHAELQKNYRCLVFEGHIRESIGDAELAEAVRTALGPLESYATGDLFKAALAEAMPRATAQIEERRRLAAENSTLRVKARIEELCAGHPQEERLRALVEAADPQTAEAVERIVSEVGTLAVPKDLNERVQFLMARSRGLTVPPAVVRESPRPNNNDAAKGLTIEQLRARVG